MNEDAYDGNGEEHIESVKNTARSLAVSSVLRLSNII